MRSISKKYAGLKLWVFTAVTFIITMGALTSRASMIGTGFNDPIKGTSGYYSTSKWFGSISFNTSLYAKMEIDSAQLYYSTGKDLAARITMAYAVKDKSFAIDTMNASLSMMFELDGREYRSYLNTGYNLGGGKGFTDAGMPEAYGNGQISFPDFGVVRTDGNLYKGRSWTTDESGRVIESWDNYQFAYDVSFKDLKGFEQFKSSMDSMGIAFAAPVPEPTSLAFVGLTSIGLIGRRRRR